MSSIALTEEQLDDKYKIFDKLNEKVQEKTFYYKYIKPNKTILVATFTLITGFITGYLTKSKMEIKK